MSKENYHHGNLKNALIEAGIELVNEAGEAGLSLRKAAQRCGVSSAAPYAHFQNKEDLIKSMQDYVTTGFMESLTAAAASETDPEAALLAVGREYIRFFIHHPHYFNFLFSQPCMRVNLSLSAHDPDNYPPYELFKKLVLSYNEKRSGSLGNSASLTTPAPMSEKELELFIIKLWSTVHGLSSIAVMENVTWQEDWEEQLVNLIT